MCKWSIPFPIASTAQPQAKRERVALSVSPLPHLATRVISLLIYLQHMLHQRRAILELYRGRWKIATQMLMLLLEKRMNMHEATSQRHKRRTVQPTKTTEPKADRHRSQIRCACGRISTPSTQTERFSDTQSIFCSRTGAD